MEQKLWEWVHYKDGSGSIEYNNQSYFIYDTAPYSRQLGIEYRKTQNSEWSTFLGSFKQFKIFAENIMTTIVKNQKENDKN